MNEHSFDIVVVGAGCAGPAAAKRAAENGLKTLLLEKANVPGEKRLRYVSPDCSAFRSGSQLPAGGPG
jgi:flavin-dependent dehydrogenase